MSTVKVSFDNKRSKEFAREVKTAVKAYFEEKQIPQTANVQMVLKTIVLGGGFVGIYALILSGWFNVWQLWGLTFLLGVAIAGIGFSISHDALHGAYSKHAWVNWLLGLSFDTLGANGYMWKITHNVIHHTYTNISGHDEDLDVAAFVRLSPHTPHKPIHRLQHVLAFPAYAFATLFWLFVKDYKYFFAQKLGPYENKKHPVQEWVTLVIMKLFTYAYQIVIPLMVLDVTWWQFLIGFLTAHLTAGLILGVVFQLAHVVEETAHPEYDATGLVDNNWWVHEMETTSNFARRNKLLSWYIGGLNYQIEHHLFPQICSIHYPEISPIVKAIAQKHGVIYNEHDTLMIAIKSHYRTLVRFGSNIIVPDVPYRPNLAV